MAAGDETRAGPRPSLPPHRPGGLADGDELSETWRMGSSDSPSREMGFQPRVPADEFNAAFDDPVGSGGSSGAGAGARKPHILASQANEWSPEFQETEVTKNRRTGLILLFLLALLLVVVIALGLALLSVFRGGDEVPESSATDTSVATEQDGTNDTLTETTLPPAETTVDPNALNIVVTEDPFICDGETRAFAQISGAAPNEEVAFESPQSSNLVSGTADANGELPIRWSCAPDQAGTAWELTATGVTSGKAATILFAGAIAPVEEADPATDPETGTGTDPVAGALSIVLNENPFACNGEVRIFGRLSGAEPGEEVAFTSPQASGISNGVADENGELPIRWSCDADRIGTSWDLTATGVSSGRTVTFSFTGG